MQKRYIIFAINMENRGKKIKMNLLVDNMMEKSTKYNEYIGLGLLLHLKVLLLEIQYQV